MVQAAYRIERKPLPSLSSTGAHVANHSQTNLTQSNLSQDQIRFVRDEPFATSYNNPSSIANQGRLEKRSQWRQLWDRRLSDAGLNINSSVNEIVEKVKDPRIKRPDGSITHDNATKSETNLILLFPTQLIRKEFIKDEEDRIKFWQKALHQDRYVDLKEEQKYILTEANLKNISSQHERMSLFFHAIREGAPEIQEKAFSLVRGDIIHNWENREILRKAYRNKPQVPTEVRQQDALDRFRNELDKKRISESEYEEAIYRGIVNSPENIQNEATSRFIHEMNTRINNAHDRVRFRDRVIQHAPLDVLRTIATRKTLEQIDRGERAGFIQSLLTCRPPLYAQQEVQILKDIQKEAASWVRSSFVPGYRDRHNLRGSVRASEYYQALSKWASFKLNLQLATQSGAPSR